MLYQLSYTRESKDEGGNVKDEKVVQIESALFPPSALILPTCSWCRG